ncbi:FecCD family ABC transporter permease [Marininema halotolerans]
MIVSVGLGEMKIPPLQAGLALLGMGNPSDEVIIYTLRLPRLLMALLVGASLAASGAILQGVMRNPLSSPDIIGITGGASVVTIFFIAFLPQVATSWLPIASFVGGSITALLIYSLAWKKGASPLRILLIGVGLNAAANGLTTLLLILSPLYSANEAMVWLTGSVYSSSWNSVLTFLPWALSLLALSYFFSRHLNAQQMGDEIATGIGQSVQWYRLITILVSIGLASSAVAFSGPIAFVGLMAPHIARMITGPSFGRLLPIASLIGALIVMCADLIARTAFSPLDLPAGLFTAVLGAPFLIFLLYRSGSKT